MCLICTLRILLVVFKHHWGKCINCRFVGATHKWHNRSKLIEYNFPFHCGSLLAGRMWVSSDIDLSVRCYLFCWPICLSVLKHCGTCLRRKHALKYWMNMLAILLPLKKAWESSYKGIKESLYNSRVIIKTWSSRLIQTFIYFLSHFNCRDFCLLLICIGSIKDWM